MYILEQTAAAFVFSCRLERRKRAGIRACMALAVLLVLALGMGCIMEGFSERPAPDVSIWNIGITTMIYSMAITAVLAGFMVFIYRISFTEALYERPAPTCLSIWLTAYGSWSTGRQEEMWQTDRNISFILPFTSWSVWQPIFSLQKR